MKNTVCQLLKIEVLDHIVMGQPGGEDRKGYVSLPELGYFY
jgi:DNA repair protein RadC